MVRALARAKKTNWQGIIGISVFPLVLGSCATLPGEINVSPGESDRWVVGVAGQRSGAIDPCLEDPIIEESIQSANLPSTHLSIKLRKTAKEEDAERIADCLRRRLKSGDVSIISPKT